MKKIRIIVDMQAAARAGRSGVGVYTAYLVEYLAKNNKDKVEIIGHYYNFLGRQRISSLPKGSNISYKVSRLIPEKVVNKLRRLGLSLPFEFLTSIRGDIHLFPNFLAQPSLFGTPAITVIHDFAFLDMPETLSQKNCEDLTSFVPTTIKISKHIIVNSQSTKALAIHHYRVPGSKITVITPAIDEHLFYPRSKNQVAPVSHKYKLPTKYILGTGTLEPRKNVESILRAYAGLDDRTKKDYGLVLVGGKGWKDESIRNTIDKLRAAGENILVTGYVPDDDLPAIYTGASLFVYPSFYEGFGIPILEAMACGVPVVCSNNTSLLEAAGDAARYVKADDVAGLTKAVSELLLNPKQAESLRQKGFAQAKKFRWEKSAKDLMTFLERLGSEN